MTSDSTGFDVGILRIEWLPGAPWSVHGRPVYPAQIAECQNRNESMPRDMVNAALHGVLVRAPDGTLGVIRGVESFATMNLSPAIGQIGILLVPVDERYPDLPLVESGAS